MVSFSVGTSLPNYLNAQTTASTGSSTGSGNSNVSSSAKVNGRLADITQAALQAAGSKPPAATAGKALDKQQMALAADLRAAMAKAGVKLAGTVEFSVSGSGAVAINASDADKAATSAFLNADASRPSFALRIAAQSRDALKASAPIQQSAAISQAARQAGSSGAVMTLYTSLLQQSSVTPAVFSVASGSSALTYPGSLTTKA